MIPPSEAQSLRDAECKRLEGAVTDELRVQGYHPNTAASLARCLLKTRGPIGAHTAKIEAELDAARRERLPHMCRDGHTEIRHALSDEDERCPVCRERDRADFAEAQVATLTARLADLEATLEPFANEADRIDPPEWSDTISDNVQVWQSGDYTITRSQITYGNLRAARSALSNKDAGHE